MSLADDSVPVSRADLEALDADDPLAPVRDRFDLPRATSYFDGNSLGPLPRSVRRRVESLVDEQWRRDLVSAWNVHGWIDLPRRVGSRIAPLVGARPEDVVVCDSVSVNLFKLMSAGLGILRSRAGARSAPRRIVVQAEHFPTDVYLAEGLAELARVAGGEVELFRLPMDDLLDDPASALAPHRGAVVSLGHVDFRTGRILPMEEVTAAIHDAGGLALWDLSHSAGALEVELAGCGVDLAVGCGYKFLNGGPGAPSFLYVAPEHQEEARTPLPGWLGHAAPFAFEPTYEPADGVRRFVCGTPPVLSLAALDAALDAWEGVDLAAVRAKSQTMGDAFLALAEAHLAPHGVEVACPRDAAHRGSQVSLRHPEGYEAVQALIERDVVGDFRAPDILRFGLAPLYQRHVEVWDAVAALAEVLASGAHREERFRRRGMVT